ncbi:hypothetical protein MUO79_00865 [Candidatus Bathyarchaeota archaeon]|nr:hypothetical protein [Candidatus Bathyarchaeota archaeon]
MSCLPDFVLSGRDIDVLRTLRTNLRIENRETFSADDVFLFGLDRFFEDKVHGVGGFFAKLQHLGKIEAVGRKRSVRPSNHLREIRVYAFVSEEGSRPVTRHHDIVSGRMVSCPGGC